MGKIRNYIASTVAITLSVSIVINPLIAYYFDVLSIISPLANILIIPIFSLCLIFAGLSIVLSFIYFPLGEIYGYVAELLSNMCFEITYIAADFKYSAISNYPNLTLISVIISAGIIYVFVSKNIRQIIFRGGVVILLIFLTTNIPVDNNSNELKVYAKEKYCLLNVPLSDGSNFVWIADRKPNKKDNQKYHRDIGLIKFIQNNNINFIAINGVYGKEFAALHCENIEVVTISHSQQRKLEKMYLDGKYIYQLK